MNEDVKRQALEEAQRTYKGFLSVAKKFSIGAIALIVFMFTQNWLVDGLSLIHISEPTRR